MPKTVASHGEFPLHAPFILNCLKTLMRLSRTSLITLFLFAAVSDVIADSGRITHDVSVGPPDHPVALKAGTTIKVLSVGATQDVIAVALPDGSSGIFQVDAAAVELSAPAAAAAPAPSNASPPVNPAATANPPAAVPPAVAKVESNAPSVPAGPPDFDHELIGGPEFDTTAGTQAAGTACLAKLKDGDPCYILTARHLLGPDGGFARETTLDQVPDFVKGIRFHSFDEKSHYFSTKGLLIQNDPADTTGLWNDLSVFPVSDGPDRPLQIAETPPAVGDSVWVVAHVRGGVPEGEIMHRAVVSVVADNFIEAIFDNDHIVPAGASGAPVLNASGEVIGVYHGHFNEKGHVGANIISARRVIADIKAAAAKN